jgi:hypothetical protein
VLLAVLKYKCACPVDISGSNQPIFEAFGIEASFWEACVTEAAVDAISCPRGHGPTLALPTTLPSKARMELTAVCYPFMATFIGVFFTYSPKHMLVWKGVFKKVFKVRTKVGVPAKKSTAIPSNVNASKSSSNSSRSSVVP